MMVDLKVMAYFKLSLSTHNWDRAKQNRHARRCEWKLYNRLKGFVTGQKAIADGLVWASLLSLVLKRRVAQALMKEGLSTLKAAKSGVTWWLPILEAVAHRAISEIGRGWSGL
jgi:hypothetical protein